MAPRKECLIVAYKAWGYAGLRICRVALCGQEMEGYRAYVFVVFPVMHLAEVCCFHTLCRLAGHWFHGFFHALCHYAYG